ncbi:MAG: hypothetical protein AAB965_01610 [Patescibacteria group bacterium]
MKEQKECRAKTLEKKWEDILKSEGLGDLDKAMKDTDATPERIAHEYVEFRMDPVRVQEARKILARFPQEGEHQGMAQALADRFGISQDRAMEIIENELEVRNVDTNLGKKNDLWGRYRK